LVVAIAALAEGHARLVEHHETVLGHSVARGLHTDVVVLNGSIGTPGITKTYHAVLTNFGSLPTTVNRCEFISDTLTPDGSVAFRLGRWDSESLKWAPLFDGPARSYCEPYPLSKIEANLAARWLWPGESPTTEWEATAARPGLKPGASARFVIDLDPRDPESREISTDHFLLDETLSVDVRALDPKLKYQLAVGDLIRRPQGDPIANLLSARPLELGSASLLN